MTTPEPELENVGPDNELSRKARCVLLVCNFPGSESLPKVSPKRSQNPVLVHIDLIILCFTFHSWFSMISFISSGVPLTSAFDSFVISKMNIK